MLPTLLALLLLSAPDLESSEFSRGLPEKYTAKVTQRAQGKRWEFRSKTPHSRDKSGTTWLKFTIERTDFADPSSAMAALVALEKSAHPDTGLTKAWVSVVLVCSALYRV